MKGKFIYETKCRRCGSLCKWTYADASEEGLTVFKSAMVRRTSTPFNYECPHCAKETIQDLVFYGFENVQTSEKFGTKI